MKTIYAVILTACLRTVSRFAEQSQRTWRWSSEYTPSERGNLNTRTLALGRLPLWKQPNSDGYFPQQSRCGNN
jgi:hypothetical protein